MKILVTDWRYFYLQFILVLISHDLYLTCINFIINSDRILIAQDNIFLHRWRILSKHVHVRFMKEIYTCRSIKMRVRTRATFNNIIFHGFSAQPFSPFFIYFSIGPGIFMKVSRISCARPLEIERNREK